MITSHRKDRSGEYIKSTAHKFDDKSEYERQRDSFANRFSPYPDESFVRVMGKVWRAMPVDYLYDLIKCHRPDCKLTLQDVESIVDPQHRVKGFDDGLEATDDPVHNFYVNRMRSKQRSLQARGYVGASFHTQKKIWVAQVSRYGQPDLKHHCHDVQEAITWHDIKEIEITPEPYRVLNNS